MLSSINSFFEKLTAKQRLLAFLCVLSISTVLLTLWTKGVPATLIVSGLLAVFLWITRLVWLPPGHGRTRVRLASLTVVLMTASTVAGWQNWLQVLVSGFLRQVLPPEFYGVLQNLPSSQGLTSGLVLAFVLVAVYIVNRDQTAMRVHPLPLDQDVRQLQNVSQSLSEDLRGIDIKTNWSASYFTPLEAEVEISTPSGITRKTSDLLKAIRKSKARLFLVLGDPGSGKSVALRKLCQDLAKEVDRTAKIPVYINLKEWRPNYKWTELRPPTVHELYAFVLANVKSRDVVTSKFFSKHFESLYEQGRLYFVLDSFDEIPAVLDEKENSELVRTLSHVIYKFLKGARAEESQGVLASRPFRRPTTEFQTEMTLAILPFTEEKVVQTLEQRGDISRCLSAELFRDRSELVPVARNPFAATLIAEYASVPGRGLPANQSEMYSSYISATLDAAEERLEQKKLDKAVVLEMARKIAHLMFQDIGLEASVRELRTRLADGRVDDVVEVLKFARLGRGVAGDESRFSFVHRRFAEYFAVQDLVERQESVKIEAIPEDSQWRDALVLYCEVAGADKGHEIAGFCWEVIRETHNPLDLRVIHCIRFLRDAFKGRPECIEPFRAELAEYIDGQISPTADMISVKLAVETVGLLQEQQVDQCVVKAMELGNSWINETALRACRHLSSISDELEKKLMLFIRRMSTSEFLHVRRHLAFSLQLSEAFKRVANFTLARHVSMYVAMVSITALTVFYPFTSFLSLCLAGLLCALYLGGVWVSGLHVRGERLNEVLDFVGPSYLVFWIILFVLIAAGFGTTFPWIDDRLRPELDFLMLDSSMPALRAITISMGLISLLPVYPYFFKHLRPRLTLDVLRFSKDSWGYLIGLVLAMASPMAVIFGVSGASQELLSMARITYGVICVGWLGWVLVLRMNPRRKGHREERKTEKVTRFLRLMTLQAFGIMGMGLFREEVAFVSQWVGFVFGYIWSLLPYVVRQYWPQIAGAVLAAVLGAALADDYRRRRRERNTIRFASLGNREAIHEVLLRLKHRANREEVLSYLEKNVREVKGSWPSADLFRVTQGNLGESAVRLCRLEERWLALD